MDHTPITIDEFKGDFKRGGAVVTPNPSANYEYTPPDHFIDSKNIRFVEGGIESRAGFRSDRTQANYRMYSYQPFGTTASRFIFMGNGGAIYDSGVSFVTPILTELGATDFSMVVMFNKAYIFPFASVSLTPLSTAYVYDPSVAAAARLAGGVAPLSTMVAANSATVGNVEAGVHLFTVAAESDSGFITKPTTAVALTCTGGFKVDLTVIPLGISAGSAKRQILATKRIVGYTGNPLDYELFFVPGGEIPNNTATTLTVNFFDADLIDSADYLIDNRQFPPGGVAAVNYEGCLAIAPGQNTVDVQSLVYVSKFGEPETFSSISGFCQVDPDFGGSIRNLISLRKILYATKPDNIYGIQGDLSGSVDALAPSSWPIIKIDAVNGCPSPHGIATFRTNSGPDVDTAIIMSRAGLFTFNGILSDQPLTWKVDSTWRGINWNANSKNQAICDPQNCAIYVLYSTNVTDSGGGVNWCDTIMYIDYKNGLDAENVKITSWKLPTVPASMVMSCLGLNYNDGGYINSGPVLLNIGTTGTNPPWWIQTGLGADQDYLGNSLAIDSYAQLGYIKDPEGALSHFNMLRGRFTGLGTLGLALNSYIGSTSLTGIVVQAATTSVGELQRIFNFVGEALSIKFSNNTVSEYFNVRPPFRVFVKKLWASRNG